MSTSETERINILKLIDESVDAADFDPATDSMVCVEHLERALSDISSAAHMLREWVRVGQSNFLGVIRVADEIVRLADSVRPGQHRVDQSGGNRP